MNKFLQAIWIVVLLLIPGGAMATQATIFGPQQYTRTTGAPDKFTATFQAETGEGRLVLKNGDDYGRSRVSSATVIVNGSMILGPDDFKRNVSLYEVPLELTAANTIAVELASAPGSQISLSIQQAKTAVPPAVTFKASPAAIVRGDSATLSWTAEGATTCSIEPGIGTVAPSGTLAVYPTETTVYTIKATNQTGSTTRSVTINVAHPLPTASISATPVTITSGDSATLSWSTTSAESCTIEPGIGTVQTSGTLVIAPTETTTYILTATGPGGATAASTTVTVNQPPPPLVIANPSPNAVVSRSDTEVSGYLNNINTAGIGITVNGVPAIIDGDRYFANHIGLTEGENIITATLTFPNGSSAQESITVTAAPDNRHISLQCLGLESGLAPLEITLRVDGNFPFAGAPTVSDSGPEPVEFLTPTEPDTIRVRMNAPGVYYLTAAVSDENGVTFSDTLAIPAVDKAVLDTALRVQWDGMKTALASGDIETGLTHFISSAREKYRILFERIKSNLPQMVSSMEDIEMIYFESGFAKYRIRRTEEVNGTLTPITYYIYFSQDSDGRYKIFKF